MSNVAELLESELKAALDVKDEKSLHNYVTILVEYAVMKSEYDNTVSSIQSDVKVLAETMSEGFKRMDERFAASDKRFDDLVAQINARFNMMFFFVSAGITMLTVLMTIYRFLG